MVQLKPSCCWKRYEFNNILAIAYQRNYVLKKLTLNKDWWKNKDREKRGFNIGFV